MSGIRPFASSTPKESAEAEFEDLACSPVAFSYHLFDLDSHMSIPDRSDHPKPTYLTGFC